VACDPLNYSGVDTTKWECARDVVQSEYGISIDADHGEATERGFTLEWSYDASTEELHIQCTEKPFFVPCSVVNGRINDTAGKCGITAV
jgi:hypothetical protein